MGLHEPELIGPKKASGSEAEELQTFLRPPTDGLRGLAHQEAAADLQQGGGALRHDGRGAEGAGRDDIGRPTAARIPADVLGPGVEDLDPVGEAQAPAGRHEVVGTAELRLHQHPRPPGRRQGAGEGGKAAARPEVENDAGAFTQQLGEGPGMTELVLEGTLADPAEALGLGQNLGEGLSQERSRPCGGGPRPRSGWPRRRCR